MMSEIPDTNRQKQCQAKKVVGKKDAGRAPRWLLGMLVGEKGVVGLTYSIA